MRPVLYILIMLTLGMASCSLQQDADNPKPVPTESGVRPDTEMKGATIYLYTGGRVTTEIHAQRLIKYETNDSTIGYKVDVDFFDSTGAGISKLVGDSSVTRELSNDLKVFGNVVVITEDKTKLETDYLHWNPEVNKIQTDAFVKITKHGDVVTGWGMEADQRLSRIKILKQVSGQFSDTTGTGLR